MIDAISNLTNNPVYPTVYNLIVIPDNILFNGHVQMGLLMIGLWSLNDLFNLLFWDDIRVWRNRVKEKIKCFLKSKIY